MLKVLGDAAREEPALSTDARWKAMRNALYNATEAKGPHDLR